eukprot:Anaeramoba_flamelloidesa90105_12.p1 GENE.a90105_12~~a90105_12.p1  ORF type:complete len:239 (-),score=58.90 a90105_12:98-814(-)
MNQNNKLNVVIFGSPSSGKSTIIGRFLESYCRDTLKNLKMQGFDSTFLDKKTLCWALNELKSQKERGLEIDQKLWQFKTTNKTFLLMDVIGRSNFISDCIANTINVGIFVIDGTREAFDSEMGVDGLSRVQANLLTLLGVKNVIVLINKMDDETINYSKSYFEDRKSEVINYFDTIGYNTQQIQVLPVSGLTGFNVGKKFQEKEDILQRSRKLNLKNEKENENNPENKKGWSFKCTLL